MTSSRDLAADMAFLRNRTKRHIGFIQVDENLMICNVPNGLFTVEQTCQYVTSHAGCSDPVVLCNYLRVMVCFLGCNSNIFGDLVIAGVFSLLVFVMASITYILIKYFILPNLLTVGDELHLNSIEFGLFSSMYLGVPDMLYEMLVCCPLQQNASLLFTGGLGKTLGCFCIGLLITSIQVPYRVTAWLFLLTMFMMIGGIVSLHVLMELVSLHELRVNSTNTRQFWYYGGAFGLALAVYILVVVIAMRSLDCKPLKSPLVAEEPQSLPNTYAGILRMSLELPPQTTDIAVAESIESVAMYSYREHRSSRSARLYVWRAFSFSLFPFQNMPGHRLVKVLFLPVWVVFAVLIPVIDKRRTMHNWCRPLVCLSFLLFPYCFLYFLPNTTSILVGVSLTAVALATAVWMNTQSTEKPKYHCILLIPSLVVARIIFSMLHKEVTVILIQMFSYVDTWELDAIAMSTYVFGNALGEVIICWQLVKTGNHDSSMVHTYGLTLCSLYTIVPQILMEACPSDDITALMTANSKVGFVFLLLLTGSALFALVHNNFELRLSFGIYMLIMYFLFITFISLAQSNQIHTYGAQHAFKMQVHMHHAWA